MNRRYFVDMEQTQIEMTDKEVLKDMLRLRTEFFVPLWKMSKQSEVPQPELSQVIRGRKKPSVRTMVRIRKWHKDYAHKYNGIEKK